MFEKLKERLWTEFKEPGIIVLEGITGAGKTWICQQTARALNQKNSGFSDWKIYFQSPQEFNGLPGKQIPAKETDKLPELLQLTEKEQGLLIIDEPENNIRNLLQLLNDKICPENPGLRVLLCLSRKPKYSSQTNLRHIRIPEYSPAETDRLLRQLLSGDKTRNPDLINENILAKAVQLSSGLPGAIKAIAGQFMAGNTSCQLEHIPHSDSIRKLLERYNRKELEMIYYIQLSPLPLSRRALFTEFGLELPLLQKLETDLLINESIDKVTVHPFVARVLEHIFTPEEKKAANLSFFKKLLQAGPGKKMLNRLFELMIENGEKEMVADTILERYFLYPQTAIGFPVEYAIVEKLLALLPAYRKDELLLLAHKCCIAEKKTAQMEIIREQFSDDKFRQYCLAREECCNYQPEKASAIFRGLLQQELPDHLNIMVRQALSVMESLAGRELNSERIAYKLFFSERLQNKFISKGVILLCLAQTQLMRGNLENCLQTLKCTRSIFHEENQREEENRVCLVLLTVLIELRRFPEAEKLVSEILLRSDPDLNPEIISDTVMFKGVACLMNKKHDNAAEALEKALQICHDKHLAQTRIQAISAWLAATEYHRGNITRAIQLFEYSLLHNHRTILSHPAIWWVYIDSMISRKYYGCAKIFIDFLYEMKAEIQTKRGLAACIYLHKQLASARKESKTDIERMKNEFRLRFSLLTDTDKKNMESILNLESGWHEESDKPCCIIMKEGKIWKLNHGEELPNSEKPEDFELYLDLNRNKCLIDGRSRPILSKKRMLQLLILFSFSAGKNLHHQEIYETIWKKPFDPDPDSCLIRVSILRLRRLLSPGQPQRFIKTTLNRDAYSFTANISCFIIVPYSFFEEIFHGEQTW